MFEQKVYVPRQRFGSYGFNDKNFYQLIKNRNPLADFVEVLTTLLIILYLSCVNKAAVT